MPSTVLFDGVCNLCNGFVRFVIARDPARRFQFASLQSDTAGRLIREAGGAGAPTDSIVLIEEARVYVRSTAALRIAKRLGLPWSLAFGLVIVPRPLRDWGYDLVARSRYRWFGKRDVCMTPTAETSDRFL